MTKLSAPGHPFQYAWHVPDLEKAIDYWANTVGVGPFFVNEVDSSTMEGFKYRGGDGNLTMRLCWGQSKEGQIELIEVTSKEPNVYHDLIPKDQTGFHHIGIWSDDYFKDKGLLTDQGYDLVMDMGVDTNICYFDTVAHSGNMLELIERNDGIVGLFGMIAKAAEDWDGTKPMRSMADLMG